MRFDFSIGSKEKAKEKVRMLPAGRTVRGENLDGLSCLVSGGLSPATICDQPLEFPKGFGSDAPECRVGQTLSPGVRWVLFFC